MLLLLVDSAVLVVGVGVSQVACNEAARSAAAGLPSALKKGGPQNRANAILERFCNLNQLIRIERNATVKETTRSPIDSTFGGVIDGTVTVATVVVIEPPFVLPHFLPKGKARVPVSSTYPFTVPI
jgi:hypothetical protein